MIIAIDRKKCTITVEIPKPHPANNIDKFPSCHTSCLFNIHGTEWSDGKDCSLDLSVIPGENCWPMPGPKCPRYIEKNGE